MHIHIYLYILCSICRITVGVETTNSLSHWKSKRKMYWGVTNVIVLLFFCLHSFFIWILVSRRCQYYSPSGFSSTTDCIPKFLRLIIICTIVGIVLCIIKEDKQRGKHRKFDMAIAWYDGNLNISGCIKIWSWFLFYSI